ncbi:homeobox KN domain-containing protein [Xylaria castorea]|nr:homeobox KN domain-containing protein [Xylaria castorea]
MTVARMTPPNHPDYYPRRIWETVESRHSTKQCNEKDEISLPSFQQTFPDLQRLIGLSEPVPDLPRYRLPRTPPSATSPTGAQFHVPITPPDYVVSPNRCKRRRVSSDEERGFYRASEVPRPYTVAHRAVSRPQSPSLEARLPFRPWLDSAPSSPYYVDHNKSLPMRSPDSINLRERTEARGVIPGPPVSNYELGVDGNYRVQGHIGDDYAPEPCRRSSFTPSNGHSADVGGHGYRPPSYPYGYHHPNRTQSLSIGSGHLDRTPFSSGGYGQHYQETYMRVNDFGMGTNGDGKQRKRRGNLPKETTEKLRSWFMSHLAHPYPTEDEKQALMRDTNLQMNQISNWFINARRRQLPHMINNARAEADAMKGRSGDGKCLSASERNDHDRGGTEGSVYEGLEIKPDRHRTLSLKRTSV